MKKFKVALVMVSIISIAFVLNLIARTADNEILERIHTELSSKDLNTIKKADSFLKEADDKLKAVEKEEESFEKLFPKKAKKGEKKAIDAKILRIEAADLRAKAYNAKFAVYKRKIESVTFEYPNDDARVKELMADADKSINTASSSLKKYMGVKKGDLKDEQYAKIQKDLAKVLELQQYAIDKVIESFEIWFAQDEKKMKEMAEKDAWTTAERSNTVSSYQAYLSSFPYGEHAADAKTKIRTLEEEERIAREEEERKNNDANNNKKENGVWYEVQVMAVTKQASPEFVAKIYKGSETVREIQQDGWFKYSVGKFSDYKEARNFRSQTGVKGAFVVAFQDEQPISIKDAKKLMKSESNSTAN